MKHFNDLPTDKFLYYLENLSSLIITEKIDGTELVVGVDDNGTLYVSREEKGGKKYYSSEEWPILFWTTGFRAAHKAIEQSKDIFRKYIKPHESIEVEILFGKCPNTIPYNLDSINRIVFLRNIVGDTNLIELKSNLKDLEISLDSIPTTNDGISISYSHKLFNWRFESVEPLSLDLPNLTNEIINFKTILEVHNNIAKLRIATNNKESVTNSRGIIQSAKDNIKQTLTNSLLNRHSIFGGDSSTPIIEGLVFRDPIAGDQFKLVDKQKFTAINSRQHALGNEFKNNIWKPLQEQMFDILRLKLVDKRIERKYIQDLRDLVNRTISEDFNDIKHKKLQRICLDALYSHESGVRTLMLFNKDKITHRSLEEICGVRQRITNILQLLMLATCKEHLIEIVLYETLEKEHKKIYTDNTRRILKHELIPTLNYISSIIGLSNLENNLLGTTGKLESSGDIDICIDESKLNVTELALKLKNTLGDDKVAISYGLSVVHAIIQIANSTDNVQVDFMVTSHINWCKFWYYADPVKSKYKGLYRNLLLRAIASSSNQTRTESLNSNELIGRTGWVIVPKGLEWQIRDRKLSMDGSRYLKTWQITEQSRLKTEPNDIMNTLFNHVMIGFPDWLTFEGLWKHCETNFNRHRLDLIKEILTKSLADVKYILPKEILKHV